MNNFELDAILASISALKDAVEASQQPRDRSRSENLDQLFTALAAAQSDMPIAGLNKTNPYFQEKYTDVAHFIQASRPYLTKNGLTVIQEILPNEDGQMILYTILGHSSGQWIESRMRIVPPKNDIQTLGSYTTYLKRLSYASLVGVVSVNEDDDGEIAMVESRQIIAKGPSTKYDPRQQSFETITKEQLDELEYELEAYHDLAEEVMDKLKIQSLADMPKSKFRDSIDRIRKIKFIRENGTQAKP